MTNHSDGGDSPGSKNNYKRMVMLGYINPLLGVKAWNTNRANAMSLLTWSKADSIYKKYLSTDFKYRKLRLLLEKEFDHSLTEQSIKKMIKYFKSGWIPENDPDWLKFKGSYGL